jgi:IS5 family transposase
VHRVEFSGAPARGVLAHCPHQALDRLAFAVAERRTPREKFLSEIERIVPWGRLIAVIEPLCPTSGRVGRQPIGVPTMLRMYCLLQWYGLADVALQDTLYDSQALRDFAGIDLSRQLVPDTTGHAA